MQVFESARSYLDAEGCHLVWTDHRDVTHRLWLDEASTAGRRYCAVLAPDNTGDTRAWAFLRFCRALSGRSDPGPFRVMTTRTETLHRQSLAALDAAEAGASEREIGRIVFGYHRTRQEWEDDAARSAVRRSLARGRRELAGGYRRFLTWQTGANRHRQSA